VERPALIQRKVQLGALALGLVSCIALAGFMRGELLHFVLAFGLGILLGPFFAVMLAISLLCYGHVRSQRATEASAIAVNFAFVGLIVALGVFLSWVPGIFLNRYDIRSAKEWAVDLVPTIERYRAEHGDYPTQIDEVASISDGPLRIRRGDLHLWTDGAEFTLELQCEEDSLMFPVGWIWTSSEKTWRYYK
jgi:hypothetical protein